MNADANNDTPASGEDLALAMREALAAIAEHDKAREAYKGYSWGWAGSALIYDRDKMLNRLTSTLDRYVDGRVVAALALALALALARARGETL